MSSCISSGSFNIQIRQKIKLNETIDTTKSITQPEIGQIITIKIDNIAFGGEGVGRINDFVVFVPLVIEGEIIEAQITEVKKSFAAAN